MPTREEIIISNVAPFLSAQQQILEIGAGNGLVAETLQRQSGATFTLLDVVDYNRTALQLHLYDGRNLPFPDNAFDLTLLIFVLHHNPDPRPVLREALRVARLGVLLVENNVQGVVRKPLTQLVDSTEFVRRGVPRCYFTKSTDEWLNLLNEFSPHAELLAEFKIGWFWNNIILRVEK
jgi:ubiquinone/menaquinone biosynthesis C-methylase UbiE